MAAFVAGYVSSAAMLYYYALQIAQLGDGRQLVLVYRFTTAAQRNVFVAVDVPGQERRKVGYGNKFVKRALGLVRDGDHWPVRLDVDVSG